MPYSVVTAQQACSTEMVKKNSNVNNPPETFACTLLADETLHSGVCKRQRTTDVSANARVHRQAAGHTA